MDKNKPVVDLEDPTTLYKLIHSVYVLLDYGDRQVLQDFGLTPTQFRVLHYLRDEGESRSSELSARLLLSKSQATRIVDSLEASNLAVRSKDGRDGRMRPIILTETGIQLHDRLNTVFTKALRARFTSLNRTDLNAICTLMDQLRVGMVSHYGLE